MPQPYLLYLIEAENLFKLDEITLLSHFEKFLNQRMIFKVLLEGKICQMSFEAIVGEFG